MAKDPSHAFEEIPHGISFGTKVVKIPNTSETFSRPIWAQACLLNNPRVLYDPYSWVKKGTNLIEFTILTPKIGIPFIDFFVEKNYNKIYIPSPVSGLLLYASHNYGDCQQKWGQTTFLLPDNEGQAGDGRYMFSQLCNFCWDNRDYIFNKQPGSSDTFKDQDLSKAFEEQKNRSCEYLEAMPEFESHFQEARTKEKHPHLRPYLKHLL